jgi:cell division initiation protein
MRVTPLEIRQQQFPLRFRGLDPGEVDKFLELVASDMEELVRENARLREGLTRKDQELQRVQKGEDELKKALVTIQQIREEWVGHAEKQAEQILRDSELKAGQLQVEAERQVESLYHDLHELKRQKQQLTTQMRHLLEEHLRLLDAMADAADVEGPADGLQRPVGETPEPERGTGDTPPSERQPRES